MKAAALTLALIVAWVGVTGLCLAAWGRVRRARQRLNQKRAERISEELGGKYLRHRPTGRVGLCVAVGLTTKGAWVAELVTCPQCARQFPQGGILLLIGTRANGCSAFFPRAELVAALGSEVEAFKSAAAGEAEG